MKKVEEEHTNLIVDDPGLLINQNWPFIGASSDGIVSCAFCGKSTLEIKCPYGQLFLFLPSTSTDVCL